MSASAAEYVATAFGASPEFYARQQALREAHSAHLARGTKPGNVFVLIDEDDWYPVYEPKLYRTARKYERDHRSLVEVPESTLARWKTAQKEFEKVQDEIRRAKDASDTVAPGEGGDDAAS